LFKNCPDVSPATVENIPVQSIRKMTLTFSKEGIRIGQEEKIYTMVDKMPEFPGGDEGRRRYVAASVKYPIEAMKAGIQGTVFVSYIVDREGNIVEAKVVRGVHQLLDQEALRVVETLPKHTPGKSNGETVRVSYTVPITFAFR
jgi:TonB family protein